MGPSREPQIFQNLPDPYTPHSTPATCLTPTALTLPSKALSPHNRPDTRGTSPAPAHRGRHSAPRCLHLHHRPRPAPLRHHTGPAPWPRPLTAAPSRHSAEGAGLARAAAVGGARRCRAGGGARRFLSRPRDVIGPYKEKVSPPSPHGFLRAKAEAQSPAKPAESGLL